MPQASPSPTPLTAEIDLIHMGDIIDVDFAGGFENDWRGPLTADGTLEGLDYLAGPIHGLCRSEEDLAADVSRIFSKILRDPQVKVKIIDRSKRPVARLDGAVKTPSRFRLQRPAHLRELLVAVGGFTDESSGEIEILRPERLSCDPATALLASAGIPSGGNGLQRLNITVKELLTGKSEADPVIRSGDLITVIKAEPIYVMGAVNNPRPIYTHSGMSLSRAVDIAGGLAKGAVPANVTIFRRDGGDSKVLSADLEKIKNGQEDDVDLKPFDIIDVASKGRPKREHPPVISTGTSQNLTELPLKIIE